ncbi:hypothetical protein [Sandarakinorhabdus oryzae]|uniref:hypothetical protein n=1 Tax=Sandarakinorhabdus oryzae TaxID=2675220 RepID=UPI0018CC0AFD|nr:hypothetical protein [Sandarakinorhabdus oryzae]
MNDLDVRGLFAEAVPYFQHSRNAPLICFISFQPGYVTHIGKGRRGVSAGTDLSRLNVTEVVELPEPISFRDIRDELDGHVYRHIDQRLRSGGLLPPASFSALVDALSELAPDLASTLQSYSRSRAQRISSLPERARDNLAEQKESVAIAMSIAGIDKRQLADWQPPADMDASTSYLDGLDAFRAREDAMVIADLRRMPGFDQVREMTHGSAVFENDFSRLTVTIANHLPLEEQLGVDLIYFNETFQSFVMVQYKAMEQVEGASEAVFRFPSAQLDIEISRMDDHLNHIRHATGNGTRTDYRFFENPFFLKFCPRLNFNPDDTGLVKGMYIPLDYWRLCATDEELVGPRGGRALTYSNVGRHLNNTEFVQVVSKGWIGTNAAQSALLIPLIREVIQTGRAVTLAVKIDKRPPDGEGESSLEEWMNAEGTRADESVQIRLNESF